MKLKHNKKRNTAFLYEVLVRHLTKSVLAQNSEKKQEILKVIKEHFQRGTELRKELEVYKAIAAEDKLDYHLAEKLLYEAKKTYSCIDRDKLFKEQSDLIKKINQLLSKDAYSVFIPNYKNLASVQQIFNDSISLKTRTLLEEKIIRNIAFPEQSSQNTLAPVDNILYRTFVKRFNKEYENSLLDEQKVLLNKFIASFADNGLEFKLYLNEEISRLKEEVDLCLKKEEVLLQENVADKVKEVLDILNEFKNQEINQEMVEQILKIQSLVKEI